MATKKKKRGRPTLSRTVRKVKRSICMSGWLWDWVDKQTAGNRSAVIQEALIERYKLKAPE